MYGLLETKVRDNFMQTGTPKMLCCKHGGSRVSVSDEVQHLPIQFVQVFKAKNLNQCCILLVGLGDPTLIKKVNEMRIGGLPLSWNGRITQNYFWPLRRQLEKHETYPHQMAKARPEQKVVKRRSLARY